MTNCKTCKSKLNSMPHVCRVYCAVCGELEVTQGGIRHPESDAIYAKIFESGCAIHYTGKEENPDFNPKRK